MMNAELEDALALVLNAAPNPIRRVDLDAYLELTETNNLAASERLRQLAIRLERHGRSSWNDIRLIYQYASEYAPTDPYLFHSWAVAAMNEMDRYDMAKLLDEAEPLLQKALELRPDESRFAYTLGVLYYEQAPDRINVAHHWFQQALTLDPNNTIAQLYSAHCYHDQHDWTNAIQAYEAVNLARLTTEWPQWRAIKCQEQLAHCYALNGQHAEAERRFSQWLDDVNKLDDSTIRNQVVNLHEIVEAITQALDSPNLRQRTQLLAVRLGFDRIYRERYAALFGT